MAPWQLAVAHSIEPQLIRLVIITKETKPYFLIKEGEVGATTNNLSDRGNYLC